MADEKAYGKCCGYNPGKNYLLIGVLAIAYGVIVYMKDVMAWQPYMIWLAVGIVFLLVGWTRRSGKS